MWALGWLSDTSICTVLSLAAYVHGKTGLVKKIECEARGCRALKPVTTLMLHVDVQITSFEDIKNPEPLLLVIYKNILYIFVYEIYNRSMYGWSLSNAISELPVSSGIHTSAHVPHALPRG